MFYIKKIFFILSFSHFIIKKKEEKENEKKIFFLWFYLNSIMWSDKAEGERYIGTSFSYVRHTPRHGICTYTQWAAAQAPSPFMA